MSTTPDTNARHNAGNDASSGGGISGATAGGGNDEMTKQQALQACAHLHEQYLACLDAGGSMCFDESAAFWKCYRGKRGTLQFRLPDMFSLWQKPD